MTDKNQRKIFTHMCLVIFPATILLPNLASSEPKTRKSNLDDNPYIYPRNATTDRPLTEMSLPDCSGLDRNYWRNWRKHYTERQFQKLLRNSIAFNTKEADQILNAKGDLFGSSYIDYLFTGVLVNQLTINLSEHPELPNPARAGLNRACLLVSGCHPGKMNRLVQGCGSIHFDFQCDLGYWVDLGRKISKAHETSGCAGGELFECSEMAFEADYLDGEIEVASCVLDRFAQQDINPYGALPRNPY